MDADCNVCKNHDTDECRPCMHSEDLENNFKMMSKEELAAQEKKKYETAIRLFTDETIAIDFSQEFYDVFTKAQEFTGKEHHSGDYMLLQTGDDYVRAANPYALIELKCNVPHQLRGKRIARLICTPQDCGMTASICTRDTAWDRIDSKIGALLTPQVEFPANEIPISKLLLEERKCVSLSFPANTVFLDRTLYERVAVLGENVSIGYSGQYSARKPTPVVFRSEKGNYLVYPILVYVYHAPCERCDDTGHLGNLCLDRLRHLCRDEYSVLSILGDEDCAPCPGYQPKNEEETK